MRIPRILIVATAVALIGNVRVASAARWEAIEALPHQKPVAVLVQDQSRIYFRITPGTPLMIPLEGPARLRVVSRVELPAGPSRVLSYRLKALEGTTVLDEQVT